MFKWLLPNRNGGILFSTGIRDPSGGAGSCFCFVLEGGYVIGCDKRGRGADKGWGGVRGRWGRVGVGVGWVGVGCWEWMDGWAGGMGHVVWCRVVGGKGGLGRLKIVSYRYLGFGGVLFFGVVVMAIGEGMRKILFLVVGDCRFFFLGTPRPSLFSWDDHLLR